MYVSMLCLYVRMSDVLCMLGMYNMLCVFSLYAQYVWRECMYVCNMMYVYQVMYLCMLCIKVVSLYVMSVTYLCVYVAYACYVGMIVYLCMLCYVCNVCP